MDKYTALKELPPAPILQIKINNPQIPKETVDQKALIDSGASRTVIPDGLIKRLKLIPASEIQAEGYKEEEEVQKHKTYFVDVEFKGYNFPYTEVIACMHAKRTTAAIKIGSMKTYCYDDEFKNCSVYKTEKEKTEKEEEGCLMVAVIVVAFD